VDEVEKVLRDFPELGYSSLADFIKAATRSRLRIEKSFIANTRQEAELGEHVQIPEEKRRSLSNAFHRAYLRRPRCPDCEVPLTLDHSDPSGRIWRCPQCGKEVRLREPERVKYWNAVVEVADQLVLAYRPK